MAPETERQDIAAGPERSNTDFPYAHTNESTRQPAARGNLFSWFRARPGISLLAIASLMVVFVVVVVAKPTSWFGSAAPAAPAQAPSVSDGPLAVAPSWPHITHISGCPAFGQVAMPPGMGKIENFHAVTDLRQDLIASGAGSWVKGVIFLDLSATNGQSIEIQTIVRHRVRRDLASPAWIYTPDSGCGPPPSSVS